VSFLARFDALDRALVVAGFPPTSPWWRSELGRFMSGARRRWVIRVGRRGGKSSTLARLAVAWALWGTYNIPPGDVGVVAFVSIDRSEAGARLRTIAKVLDVLGVDYDQRAEEIELKDKPITFRVTTCSITAVGFTSILVVGDEVARWESRESASNPAKEVIGSLSPTMATQPAAFLVLSSSPWSLDDFHHEQFAKGDTDHQCASFAPTWIANPTITEAQTRELEPDARVWSREYAAQPTSALSAAFDADYVLACFDRVPQGSHNGGNWIAVDPSELNGKGDGFGYMAGTTTDADEIVIIDCGEWGSGMSVRSATAELEQRARKLGVSAIFSDQRERVALRIALDGTGIELKDYTWSEPSKEEAILMIKRWLLERRLLVLGAGAGVSQLKNEMLSVKARALPSGRMVYDTSGLDVLSCLITLAHAACKRDFAFSSSNPLIEAIERNRREHGSPYAPGFIPFLGRAVGFY
jgi:hypothetical protein